MYPFLSKSYRGVFPFNIGTTSFIYPDDYVPNVKMLGPYLENIELLLFESQHTDALPSRQVINELTALAKHFNLTYNVHLPTDISISSRDPQQQRLAVETIIRVADRVQPLNPTTLTLHVPYNETSSDESGLKSWQERVINNLKQILAGGTPGQLISIENLDYPFEILDPIICDLDLTICLDYGHLILQGDDIDTFFKTYAAKTAIIHLYGVAVNHFHFALDRLPEKFLPPIMGLLANFKGTVSMEVFSYADLDASLKFMEKCWDHQQKEN
ncbi:MAG: cobamide remodeling phosphodiesterase CbiR [Deltaproteobacteria bacterium]|jgi:sugar phosphate isomerase/epimerase